MTAVFKNYTISQGDLFPLDLNRMIGEHHKARLLHLVIEKLDLSDIISSYKSGGTSSYPPEMMLKILFYGYLNNIYSCRKIEEALRENIGFMWLAGGLTPDFRTINRFRGEKLKDHIEDLFTGVVELMVEAGFVSLERQYIDGTKIEADANKYTFVWKKSVEKYKAKLQAKIKAVLEAAEQEIDFDNQAVEIDPAEINPEFVREKLERINEKIKENRLSKEQKKAVKNLENKQLVKLEEYEEKLEILGDRNSYSKTDTDAVFMRTKDDAMKNGQLKPSYNSQISTENQFVTHYSLHQTPGDTRTLEAHLEGFEKRYARQSSEVCADAAYGSEENYQRLENQGITAVIPYNMYRIEKTAAYKKKLFEPTNMFYNAEQDFYVCPADQQLKNTGTLQKTTAHGFVQEITVYEAQNCLNCPLREQCFKGEGNRRIERNKNLNRLRTKAKECLESEEGREIYAKRKIEPEPVFGNLKRNKGFRRFSLRGLSKVRTEFGLLVMAHNLSKMFRPGFFAAINPSVHFFELILLLIRSVYPLFCKNTRIVA